MSNSLQQSWQALIDARLIDETDRGAAEEAMRTFKPPTRRTCALVVLPDYLDCAWWQTVCAEADDRANLAVKGKSVMSGLGMRSLITYPELRGCLAVKRVYVAWRGYVRFWHRGADHAPMTTDYLSKMDPTWAARMRVGDAYLWVASQPVPVPELWPAPPVPSFRYGLLHELSPYTTAPRWL